MDGNQHGFPQDKMQVIWLVLSIAVLVLALLAGYFLAKSLT